MIKRDVHPLELDFAEREPDLVIAFDGWSFEKNQAVIEELKRGDLILFNASISHLGVKKFQDHGELTKYQANDEE